MEKTIIQQLEQEATDLNLHVDLCHHRYLQLIAKFDIVDLKFESMTATLNELKLQLSKDNATEYKTYLHWAGYIICGLAGIIAHHLLK